MKYGLNKGGLVSVVLFLLVVWAVDGRAAGVNSSATQQEIDLFVENYVKEKAAGDELEAKGYTLPAYGFAVMQAKSLHRAERAAAEQQLKEASEKVSADEGGGEDETAD